MSGQIDMFKSKTKKDKQNKDPKSHVQEHKEPKFKVYINAGEMERIHEWVMEHPDIETGYGQIVLGHSTVYRQKFGRLYLANC